MTSAGSQPRPNLRVARDGATLWVTIDRPEKRNALSRATLAEIETTFAATRDAADLKLAVLTGAGDKSFAAGGDLGDLSSIRDLDGARTMAVDAKRALEAIRDCPVPVIALLNGDALGGGAETAVACDFRIAMPAARIGFIQGRLNISTAWGGGIDLLSILGPVKALRLMATGRIVAPDEALQLGLFDAVAEDGQSGEAAVAAFCADMLRQTPQVLRTFKALSAAHRRGEGRQQLLERETSLFAGNWVHDDHWAAADKVLKRSNAG